jgi:uncharacterized damage-inducible protein DinB
MATTAQIWIDAFGRIREEVHAAVEGLRDEQLSSRPGPEANSIGWLVWHLTRIQDDHIADVAGIEQVYTAQGWDDRLGLPFSAADTGYGHGTSAVAAVQGVSAKDLLGYHDAAYEQTIGYVRDLTDGDLDRVVDERWDPPVTLAVRLVSIVSDDLQHVGQAAFVRGLIGA